MHIETDIPYREVEGYEPALNTLDIYFRPLRKEEEKRRVVVFIHGGNWRGGDKECFTGPQEKTIPAWFVENGYVFVSVNFRLPEAPGSPEASVADMADDISKAIKWLTINGRRYGGQNTGYILVGYSSGAHLAALVAANKTYLARYRLSPPIISAVIGLDVPIFDVPAALEILQTEPLGLPNQSRRASNLLALMGSTRAEQESVSPAAHIGPWLKETRFLLLSAGYHQGQPQDFSRRMSAHFRDYLEEHGIVSEHRHFDDLNHTDFISRYHGEISSCVESFLRQLSGHSAANT